MAHDRLIFEKHVLPNGLTVYHKPMDVPFAMMRIVVPLGHIHNTGELPGGAAHFLEHMVCSRCAAYPESDSFDPYFELNGGDAGAATGAWDTVYRLDVPTSLASEAITALVSRVFEPIFDDQGVAQQRQVIVNEGRRKSRWYPANSEIAHYCDTQWMDTGTLALQQSMGLDDDLERIDTDLLRRLHPRYFDPRTFALIGGSCNASELLRVLSQFETTEQNHAQKIPPVRWVRREYHEKAFEDQRTHTYHVGGLISGEYSKKVSIGMQCIADLLVHPSVGALYDWLRRERNWTYSVGFEYYTGRMEWPGYWQLHVPLNNRSQVETVRKELRQRIEAALGNRDLVHRVVERATLASVFGFQRLGDTIDYAKHSLTRYGKIISEIELREVGSSLADGAYLQELYRRHFTDLGEFLALPLDG